MISASTFCIRRKGKGCQIGRTLHKTRICLVREAQVMNYASIQIRIFCRDLCLDPRRLSSLHLRTNLWCIPIQTHTRVLIIAFRKLHTNLQPQNLCSTLTWLCEPYLPWTLNPETLQLYLSFSKTAMYVSAAPQEHLWSFRKRVITIHSFSGPGLFHYLPPRQELLHVLLHGHHLRERVGCIWDLDTKSTEQKEYAKKS